MELRSRRKCLSSEKSDKREEEESDYSLSSDSDDENDLWDEMEEANKVKVLDLNGEPSESSDVCYVAETSAKKRKRSDAKKESVGPSHQEKEMHREDDGSSDESADSLSSPITSRVINLPMQEYSWRSYKEAKKKRGKKKREIALKWEIWEKELDAWIKKNSGQDLDLDNLSERVNEITEAPSDVVIPLLRYQKEWLSWALKQERSEARGGILADEMGMGKTIQAIALVLAKRENSRHVGQPGGEEETSAPTMDLLPGLFQKLPKIKATLVICPVVAVSQWVNEINRFTAEGSTKVLIYHGAKRGKSLHEFSKYDFVITTYSTVENEYRRNIMPPKKACCYCGKLFLNEKLSYHQKYFCGPSAVKTTKQSKQETKGKRKMEKTVEGRRPRARKTGKDQKGFKEDMDSDSSSGVENTSSLKKGLSSPPVNSILHTVKWERIILDEAHSIKDRQCNTAKAVFALVSLYKWALSGTPLQNRVGELYSLIRLLQIVPYSYYFCKDCDCMTLDYSTTKDCKSCQHSATRHFCWWNKFVAKPIQVSGGSGDGKNAMILLRHKILKTILLRRTKKSRAADLALPPRIVSLRRDTMDIKEEDYYTSLYNESQSQFNTYVQAGTLLNNYAHVFDLLTRLRQAVNHPYLVVYSRVAAMRNEMMNNSSKSEVCGLCAEQGEDIVVTGCEHVFCKMCLIDFTSGQEQASCPSCSKPMTVDLSTSVDFRDQAAKASIKGFRAGSILNRIQLDDFQTSTKIDALREEIRFMIERDGSAKGIVFSQFTSFLDLINYSLQKSGISTVQLVGSMTMSARDAAIKRFIEDPECKIFLMSLKAGGVALNLTVASHVFLMDPWWNPAVERQAQDRIHRIGQYKPIRIVRFVIKDTIEERILRLQEKKEQLFDGTIGGDTEAMGKLSVTDLKFLFVT